MLRNLSEENICFESINNNTLNFECEWKRRINFSKSALMGTKPGKQIIKQGLFKSKGYKLFNQYKEEAEDGFPTFAQRFAKNLFEQINADQSPNTTQQQFAEEVGSTEIILNASEIEPIKSKIRKILTPYKIEYLEF